MFFVLLLLCNTYTHWFLVHIYIYIYIYIYTYACVAAFQLNYFMRFTLKKLNDFLFCHLFLKWGQSHSVKMFIPMAITYNITMVNNKNILGASLKNVSHAQKILAVKGMGRANPLKKKNL